MSDGGKGSKARPIEVSSQTYSDNWERTFGKHSCKATISGCANDGCTGIANCLFSEKEHCYNCGSEVPKGASVDSCKKCENKQ
jgi:hypothetical protein